MLDAHHVTMLHRAAAVTLQSQQRAAIEGMALQIRCHMLQAADLEVALQTIHFPGELR